MRDFNAARQRAVNAIYLKAAEMIELMENRGQLVGNAHHMAQLIADYADDLLKKRAVISIPSDDQIKTRES